MAARGTSKLLRRWLLLALEAAAARRERAERGGALRLAGFRRVRSTVLRAWRAQARRERYLRVAGVAMQAVVTTSAAVRTLRVWHAAARAANWEQGGEDARSQGRGRKKTENIRDGSSSSSSSDKSERSHRSGVSGRYPTPYTLHYAPYTLHPTPYTLHHPETPNPNPGL